MWQSVSQALKLRITTSAVGLLVMTWIFYPVPFSYSLCYTNPKGGAPMRFRKVYLEISNICNLSCRFFPGTKRSKKAQTAEEMSLLLPWPFSPVSYRDKTGSLNCRCWKSPSRPSETAWNHLLPTVSADNSHRDTRKSKVLLGTAR